VGPTQWSPGSFPGHKAAGALNPPFTSIWCRGYERVELYRHSPYVPSWQGQAQRFRFATNCCDVGLPQLQYLQLMQVFQIPTISKLLGNQRPIRCTVRWESFVTFEISCTDTKKCVQYNEWATSRYTPDAILYTYFWPNLYYTHSWKLDTLLSVYEDRRLELYDRPRHLSRPAVSIND